MKRVACLVLAGLLCLAGLVGTSGPASARAATLTVSPGNGAFTAGQQLTFAGRLGRAGRRTVVLQSNMGRPGDVWLDVRGARARTTASGRFVLRTPAPSMLGMIYRVSSGRLRTPTWTSQVTHQDVVLRTEGTDPATGETHAPVGAPLTIVADTRTMPLLAGRAATLQQRVGVGWTPVATGAVAADGTASFVVTPSSVGTVVYRVRLENWRSGGDRVGWFPSYPLHVHVLATRAGDGPRSRVAAPTRFEPAPAKASTTTSTTTSAARARAPFQTTASRTYRWGTTRFDFDWETGESLTDRPTLGSAPRGRWLDASDGTGRVALRNGAMQLSSNIEGPGRLGSRGSMWATLQGNPQSHGRWETRVMPMVFGGGATHYRVVGELVPTDPAQARCGARTITVFDIDAGTTGVRIGANGSDGSSWARTVPGVTVDHAFHAYGVEVTKRRITWFVDGKPVGKVTDAGAVSGLPMTMRVTMQAAGAESMRTTRTLVDWVRGFPGRTGLATRGGVRLARGTHSTC